MLNENREWRHFANCIIIDSKISDGMYGVKVNMKNKKTKTIKLNERQRAFLLHKIVLPVKKKKNDEANDILSNKLKG